ncbi:FtsK/SpoIIIE domain-containing protein [Liquorilactobacillus satsumensis]|uniref:FtsK/SpoIIIE domain-containing protein n=1 Tax=Liquorilactobacillus satsumensis TaxID=259059 RepID=UPI0039ED5A94
MGFKQKKTNLMLEYIKDVLRYILFSNSDQNAEYDLLLKDDGMIFVPIYPITYVIDEAFYNKIFNVLNLALTPEYTLIRPLTMQVVVLETANLSQERGLFFPMRKGTANRLNETMEQIIQRFYQTGRIPIMDIIDWDFVKAPHAIITGVSGSGKSYYMKVLFQICSIIGNSIAIDPKGSDLARLAHKQGNEDIVIPQFISSGNGEQGIGGKFLQDVIKALKNIESIMYERQSRIYQNSDKVSTDYRELGFKPYFVFIDELAALLTGANKAVKDDFQNTLTRLIVLGREAGIYLILAMQSARAEYVPTIVRDSISLRIQLGRINSENTRFLFPELNEMPMVPMGGKGTGIISIAGDSRYSGIEPIATPTII